MSKKVSYIVAVVFLYGLLAACAELETPVPPANMSLSPAVTTAASASTAGLPAPASPSLLPATPASLTAGLTPVTSLTAPATFSSPPLPVPATSAVPVPVFSPPSTASPASTATITPGPNVPLLPIRRISGTLTAGVLESDFKARNFSPYAPDLNEVSLHLQHMVWNARLLYLDPVRLDWKILAARSLPTVENGGRRYTFNLREDLVWSDGSPITSADYIYAFKQAIRPENRYPALADLQHISQLDGPDLRTLVFTLDDTYSTALNLISTLEPLPVRVWSKYPFANPALNPEISGPSLTSGPFVPGTSVQNLVPASNYFQGQPNFQRITLRLMKNRAELYDNLKSGQVGWTLEDLPPGSYSQFRNINNLTVYRWYPQDAASRYIGYNLNNGFFQTRAVRQALNRLLDTRSLLATVDNGLGTEQPGFLPVSCEFALKTPDNARFNLRLARAELKEAGYEARQEENSLADLDGKPVSPLELVYPNNSSEADTIALYIIQQYQQAGLTVVPVKLEPSSLLKRLKDGKYDLELGLLHLPGALDPDDYKAFFTTRGAFNYSGYSNKEVDQLFAAGVHVPDSDQKSARRPIYENLQRLIADDSPLFFLYTLQAYTVMTTPIDPGGGGTINLARWQLAWDAFPAYLNWYTRDSF